MNCERCDYCQYPRTPDDNNGLCKCKAMKRKTIDVYVGGGETPDWCPIKDMTPEEVLHEISTQVFRNTDDCEMKVSKRCYKGIVDAVERLIGKEVKQWLPYTTSAKCPACGKPIDSFKGKDFCCWCGQKVIWGVEE